VSEVRVFADAAEVARAAAEDFVTRAAAAIAARGRFAVALSGGSTPLRTYALLASDFRDWVDWSRVHLFWGDERAVPPADPESNYGAAERALVSKVPIPTGNVHRIEAERPVAEAAARYEDELKRFFELSSDPQTGRFPRFDLVFLGLGPDGHTASLFPGSEAVREARRLVVAPFVEKLKAPRITLTAPVFNAAERAVFLVTGREKAAPFARIRSGRARPDEAPAAAIRPHDGTLAWYVDVGAAGS
jgi:6-phosphogluconolactonase